MSDIGNIKPPGPVWPSPGAEKIKRKEDAKDRQCPQREPPQRGDEDEEGGGIDEYA